MNALTSLSDYITDQAESLANEVVETVLEKISLQIPTWEKEQAIEMYVEFLTSLGNMIDEKEELPVPASLMEWSKKNAERQAASGGDISEIVVRYPPTREAFNEILTRISSEYGLTVQENAFILKQINALLDVSLNETVFAFEKISVKYKKKTEKELAELSAPIVPVKEDVAILSLSGDLNSYRTDHIMTNVIPRIADVGFGHVIIDFSGIYTINEEIAHSLYQIEKMFRVMGIDVSTTGLRPEIVQSLVNFGIDLSAIRTFATVKQALENIK